jgi:rhamnosyl/mannosyltransferase
VQLEAHAAGTPVVSTRLTTGVPFVNQDGVTGLTVPPGDAEALAASLETLIADEGLRAELGSRAKERVQSEFTTERMVRRTIEIYKEALQLGSSAPSSNAH